MVILSCKVYLLTGTNTYAMGHTDSENNDEDALFRTKLIEKLMKFGNRYEESLAIVINRTDVSNTRNNIIDNQDNQNQPQTNANQLPKGHII